MKTLQQFAKYILLSLLIVAGTSCSKDDDGGGNDEPQLQGGADHQFSLTFSGGQFDGETKSVTIPNDDSSPVVSAYAQNPDNGLEIISLSMNSDNLGVVGVFTRDGNQTSFVLSDDYSEEDESGSFMYFNVPNNDGSGSTVFVSESGMLNISNFQTFSPSSFVGVAYYSLTFEGVFEVEGTGETVTVTGSASINPPS